MWKDILVHIDGLPAGKQRAQYALALAEQSGARLSGLHVRAPVEVPPIVRPRMIETVGTQLEKIAVIDARKAEDSFREVVTGAVVASVWHSADGNPVAQICAHARYADLVVLGQYETFGTPERHPVPLANSVVVDSGCPVLAVPTGFDRMPDGMRVLLAWDGHPHTVRALHDAMPLLRRAKRLVVLSVNPESERLTEPAPYKKLLADHLALHGVVPEEHLVIEAKHRHATEIEKHFQPLEFDLVVMGAYSYPVWIEMLFGGTTLQVMLSAPIPVFLSP